MNKIGKIISGLMPLTFIVGCFFFSDDLGNSSSFLIHSLLACVATFIIVSFAIRNNLSNILPVTVIFLIFVFGYYIKFYWIMSKIHDNDLNDIANSVDSNVLRVLTQDNLIRAFELTTYGYLAFTLAVIFIALFRFVPPRSHNLLLMPIGRKSATIVLASSFFFCLLTGLLFYKLGIGVRGAENIALPFKLTGIITYIREFTFYLFVIVFIWAEERRNKLYWYFSLLGLLLFVGSKIFLEASRGAPVALVIALGTLWLVYNRFTKTKIVFLGTVFAVVVILRPFFTIYRELKRFDVALNPMDLILKAFQQLDFTRIDVFEFLLGTLKVILLRIIGIDSVLYVTDKELVAFDLTELTAVITGGVDFAQKFTQDVVGYGASVTTHYSAPSLIGGTYLLGGLYFMIIFVLFFTLISQYAWKVAMNTRWRSKPVILVIIVSLCFSIGSEGNIINAVKELMVTIMFLLCLEGILRLLSPRHSQARKKLTTPNSLHMITQGLS